MSRSRAAAWSAGSPTRPFGRGSRGRTRAGRDPARTRRPHAATVPADGSRGRSAHAPLHLPRSACRRPRPRLRLRDSRQPAVERIRPAVPRARDIPVAVQRHHRPRQRLHVPTRHQRQVAAGGAANHTDPCRVEPKLPRSLGPYPGERVDYIAEDRRKLCLRRQPVVDRDLCEAGTRQPVPDGNLHPPAGPGYQRATVDPDHYRCGTRPVRGRVDIQADLAAVGPLEDDILHGRTYSPALPCAGFTGSQTPFGDGAERAAAMMASSMPRAACSSSMALLMRSRS